MMSLLCSIVTIVLAGALAGGPAHALNPNARDDGRVESADEPAAFPFDPLSSTAIELLTESIGDSCSICARQHRQKAFELLDESLRPGMVLKDTAGCSLLSPSNGKNELSLSCFANGPLYVTFRFHTNTDHYVGIGNVDFTADSLAVRLLSLAKSVPLTAEISVVTFAYGNGETFLFIPSENQLQIQCRVSAFGGQR